MQSRNRRWPSAKSRSKTSVLLPDPLTPVTTTNRCRGIVSERFFRLCSRAPTTTILFGSVMGNSPATNLTHTIKSEVQPVQTVGYRGRDGEVQKKAAV